MGGAQISKSALSVMISRSPAPRSTRTWCRGACC